MAKLLAFAAMRGESGAWVMNCLKNFRTGIRDIYIRWPDPAVPQSAGLHCRDPGGGGLLS